MGKKIAVIITIAMFLTGCAGLAKPPASQLKYNYFEKVFTHAPYDSELKYNYLENKYEWSR